MTSFHESYRSHDPPKASSPRAFGFVFAAFFALLALGRFLKGGGVRSPLSGWMLAFAVIALAFTVLALARPLWLAPLNKIWLAFGSLLHRVVSPVVLGIVFFAVVWPIGLVMRMLGKDPLRLKLQRGGAGTSAGVDSYWIVREPAPADHFTHQF